MDALAALRAYPSRSVHRIVGVMTGTSADAIDLALVRIAGDLGPPVVESARDLPLDEALRREILEVAGAERLEPERLMRLDAALGDAYAAAIQAFLASAGVAAEEIDAVGLHGQTVRHVPRAAGAAALTLQIGSAAIVAERTGLAVVSNFRSRDVAAGGEGAPLVPLVDWLWCRSATESRALLNIGGMANLTHLPAGAAAESILAFDTGPGNAVIDALMRTRADAPAPCDREGAAAARGTAHAALLDDLLGDPFFAQAPPRSTGRERFGAGFAAALRDRGTALGLGEDDLAATATELTAASIAGAIRTHVVPRGLDAVYVSGGGGRNPTLMAALARRLAPLPVRSTAALGIAADSKEAVAFAVLAHLTLSGLPGNAPAATGAARAVVLGNITPGRTT